MEQGEQSHCITAHEQSALPKMVGAISAYREAQELLLALNPWMITDVAVQQWSLPHLQSP